MTHDLRYSADYATSVLRYSAVYATSIAHGDTWRLRYSAGFLGEQSVHVGAAL